MCVSVFVGIDLAWSVRALTGLAAVDASGALVDSTALRSDEEIDLWLARAGWAPFVAAIDAPLVVGNQSGQRSSIGGGRSACICICK